MPPKSDTAQYQVYASTCLVIRNHASCEALLILWLLHPLSNPPPPNVLLSYPTDPSPPRNVAITRMFQDGVELNWLPPTEPNGEVHYVIEYKREDSGSWTSVNTTSDSTHYNLTGLHSSTNYTIRVVAVNMMKQASFTMSSTATPTSSSTATLNFTNRDKNSEDTHTPGGHM